MKTFNITAKVQICSYEELQPEEKNLIQQAKASCSQAYAPYSQFHVGAAVLLANGEIVTGTNQENVAFPSGLCAERTALFYANSQYPEQAVLSLAIAAYTQGDFIDKPISPCGACRQVILETEMRYKRELLKIHSKRHCEGDSPKQSIKYQPYGLLHSVRNDEITEFLEAPRNPIRILLYGKSEIYIVEGINDLLPLAFGTLES